MSDDTDYQLILKCMKGNIKAFEILYDRYEKVIFNTALRITGDIEDSKDATQITFLKVFKNLNSFNPNHKFYSWIYRIVLNVALDINKRKKKHDSLDKEMISMQINAEEKLIQKETVHQIDDSLMELDDYSRALIVLKYYGDLSYNELSYVFEISQKKIKSRLYSARKSLRYLLKKKELNLD